MTCINQSYFVICVSTGYVKKQLKTSTVLCFCIAWYDTVKGDALKVKHAIDIHPHEQTQEPRCYIRILQMGHQLMRMLTFCGTRLKPLSIISCMLPSSAFKTTSYFKTCQLKELKSAGNCVFKPTHEANISVNSYFAKRLSEW